MLRHLNDYVDRRRNLKAVTDNSHRRVNHRNLMLFKLNIDGGSGDLDHLTFNRYRGCRYSHYYSLVEG